MTVKINKTAEKKPLLQKQKSSELAAILNLAPASPFPKDIKPMLATLVDEPFDSEGWIYEVKWDGYRAIAYLNNGNVDIQSRNNKTFNEKFYPVREALSKWNLNAVLDGEIIVANKQGMANFSHLQNWRSEADGQLLYYVFDILWYQGKVLTSLPLQQRKEILKAILPNDELVHLSETFNASGIEFYNTAMQLGLEGIMAKRLESVYLPNDRSRDWLKIKTQTRQEVVIGGFTKNDGSSKPFSSLLVGVYENNQLVYTGKIGTGFTAKLQKEMMEMFKPLITDKSPFTTTPDINKPSRFRPNPPNATATWLKPKLLCEVSYREMTSDGVMRHPSFEGMRTDKAPGEVILEKEIPVEKIIDPKQNIRSIIHAPKEAGRKTLLNPKDETQVRSVGGRELKFSNLSKIYWPKEKITKRDMLNYYYQVAPYILPYLKDRPESLNRFPNGITGKSFYQKNVTGKVPAWMKTYPYTSEGTQKNFLICNDEASLLYMASLGSIEMNPWSSRIQNPDNPDWCIIDLDPDKQSFDQVIETANVTRQVLSLAGIEGYCKTSGSTGLHIYIPLGAKYTYEESKEFGRLIARIVNEQLPKFTSIERMISNRGGKLYIDFLQNRPGATLASAYSLRPKPGATVSMPLHWDEVKKGLKMKDFTIHNAVGRLSQTGDIFKPVLGKGINMQQAIKKLIKELHAAV